MPNGFIPESDLRRIQELRRIVRTERDLTEPEKVELRTFLRTYPRPGDRFVIFRHPAEVISNDGVNIHLRNTDGYAPPGSQRIPYEFITIHGSLPEDVFPKAPRLTRFAPAQALLNIARVRSAPMEGSPVGRVFYLDTYLPQERTQPRTFSYRLFQGVKKGEQVVGMPDLRTRVRQALWALQTGAVNDVVPMPGRQAGVEPNLWRFLEGTIPREPRMRYLPGLLTRTGQLPGFIGPGRRYHPSIQEHEASLKVEELLAATLREPRRVILVDDVLNEGRTMRAAMRVLGAHGIEGVPLALGKTERVLPAGHGMETDLFQWTKEALREVSTSGVGQRLLRRAIRR